MDGEHRPSSISEFLCVNFDIAEPRGVTTIQFEEKIEVQCRLGELGLVPTMACHIRDRM
jgi:hypothetical protein